MAIVWLEQKGSWLVLVASCTHPYAVVAAAAGVGAAGQRALAVLALWLFRTARRYQCLGSACDVLHGRASGSSGRCGGL